MILLRAALHLNDFKLLWNKWFQWSHLIGNSDIIPLGIIPSIFNIVMRQTFLIKLKTWTKCYILIGFLSLYFHHSLVIVFSLKITKRNTNVMKYVDDLNWPRIFAMHHTLYTIQNDWMSQGRNAKRIKITFYCNRSRWSGKLNLLSSPVFNIYIYFSFF